MDLPVEDQGGVVIGFPGPEGEKDGHCGFFEVRTMLRDPNGDGCVQPIGKEGIGEDTLLEVLGKTGPGKGTELSGFRRGASLLHRPQACSRRTRVTSYRGVKMHRRHRAASRGKSRLLRPDLEDGHLGNDLAKKQKSMVRTTQALTYGGGGALLDSYLSSSGGDSATISSLGGLYRTHAVSAAPARKSKTSTGIDPPTAAPVYQRAHRCARTHAWMDDKEL